MCLVLYTYLMHISSHRRRSPEKQVNGTTSERGESVRHWYIDEFVLRLVAQYACSERFALTRVQHNAVGDLLCVGSYEVYFVLCCPNAVYVLDCTMAPTPTHPLSSAVL